MPSRCLTKPEKHSPVGATRAGAEARTLRIRNAVEEYNQTEASPYNAQPDWRMREFPIDRTEEAAQVLNEFLRMVDRTSAEFCWPLRDPSYNPSGGAGHKSLLVFCALPIDWSEARVTRVSVQKSAYINKVNPLEPRLV
jgi:hypothetical protein